MAKTICGVEVSDVEALKKRFLEKTEMSENGCLIWKAGKTRKGYGYFSIGNSRTCDGKRINSMKQSHRVSYELFIGEIPKMEGHHGACILHKCDTPSCVNPDHLFVGTNAENVKDMDRKGRRVTVVSQGESSPHAKLTEKEVLFIYNSAKNKTIKQNKLAIMFGVSTATISSIVMGRNWSHLTGASNANS
ncbi:MAG: HNH endonuclease signature motif containing protein [Vibrio sp.]